MMVVSRWRSALVRCALGFCCLFAALASRTFADEKQDVPVTFSEHIAPILWNNCAGCHRPGEVGPFSLLTYRDAAKRARFLTQVTHERLMPPWKPAPGGLAFHGERRLTDDEVALIARWSECGAPEGDPADLPDKPEFCDGWQLGEPDLVLTMRESYAVPAGGRDVYRCFVIPIPIDEDRMVAAAEFRPGNRSVVHHSIMFLDANGAARKRDSEDSEPGYQSFGGAGVPATGGLGAWLPGTAVRLLPEGTARYVCKGSDLVLQIHYHPTGKAETDRSSVGIYFAKKPVEKIVTGIAVTQPQLCLPAGKSHCDVLTRSRPLPVDVNVLGVSPHMHYLGRKFKLTARLPGGEMLPLISILDWDVNWQGTYHFTQPVKLPKGTVLCLHAVYDNSADNPLNPNSPPREVRWGELTTDEMCLCGVQVTTDNPEDLAAIARMPGYELAVGLEGGIPGLAEDARRETKRKQARPVRTGGVVFPPEGIPVFQDRQRLLIPFDRDKNGFLSREEISRMSGPMQSYVLRRYFSSR